MYSVLSRPHPLNSNFTVTPADKNGKVSTNCGDNNLYLPFSYIGVEAAFKMASTPATLPNLIRSTAGAIPVVNDKGMELNGDLPILSGNYSLYRPFQFDLSCLLNHF